MMNNLTPAQAKVLKKIEQDYNKLPTRLKEFPMPVAMRWKDSWVKNWTQEGLNTRVLRALDKKGVIKLKVEFDRQTGVFNPRADSWGYSSMTESYSVELIK
jgi:hypothetical protein